MCSPIAQARPSKQLIWGWLILRKGFDFSFSFLLPSLPACLPASFASSSLNLIFIYFFEAESPYIALAVLEVTR